MQVEIRLYATLRRHLPELKAGEPHRLTLSEGATVKHVLASLGVPEDSAKQAFVNDVAVELDHVLREHDLISVFPPLGGGG